MPIKSLSTASKEEEDMSYLNSIGNESPTNSRAEHSFTRISQGRSRSTATLEKGDFFLLLF